MANYEERETCMGEKNLSGWKAGFRGEDMKGVKNNIVSRSPSVKWRPVRIEAEYVFISAGVAEHVIPRMNRTPRNTTVPFS